MNTEEKFSNLIKRIEDELKKLEQLNHNLSQVDNYVEEVSSIKNNILKNLTDLITQYQYYQKNTEAKLDQLQNNTNANFEQFQKNTNNKLELLHKYFNSIVKDFKLMKVILLINLILNFSILIYILLIK